MPTDGRLPIVYPKHIACYLQCPERYYHQHVERRRVEQPVGPDLARGIAAHRVLHGVALDYQKAMDRVEPYEAYEGPAVPCDLLARAEAALPRAPYPSDQAWRLDILAVAEDVKFGVAYLDGDARVVAAEATLFAPRPHERDCPPFALAAKVDLVLLRRDGAGRPYLDVVDHKSGRSLRPDPIEEIAARVVAKQNAKRLGVAFDYIQSTTLHLGARAARSDVLNGEECGRRWAEVKRAVAAILGGADWAPSPSPLCEWCPYFNNGCSVTPEGGEVEGLEEWLDGAAD